MARKAEDEQVLVGVIAAPQNRKAVMQLQLPLGAWHSADLAASTALGDQAQPPGRRELDGARAHVVGGSEPFAQGQVRHQGRESSTLSL